MSEAKLTLSEKLAKASGVAVIVLAAASSAGFVYKGVEANAPAANVHDIENLNDWRESLNKARIIKEVQGVKSITAVFDANANVFDYHLSIPAVTDADVILAYNAKVADTVDMWWTRALGAFFMGGAMGASLFTSVERKRRAEAQVKTAMP